MAPTKPVNQCVSGYKASETEAFFEKIDESVDSGNPAKIREAAQSLESLAASLNNDRDVDRNAMRPHAQRLVQVQMAKRPPNAGDEQTFWTIRNCVLSEKTALVRLEDSRQQLALAHLSRTDRATVGYLFRQVASDPRFRELKTSYPNPVERAQVVCVLLRSHRDGLGVSAAIREAVAHKKPATLAVVLDRVLASNPRCTIYWVEERYAQAKKLADEEQGQQKDEPACMAAHPVVLAQASLSSGTVAMGNESVDECDSELRVRRRKTGYEQAVGDRMVTGEALQRSLEQAGLARFWEVFRGGGTEKLACDLLIGLGYRYTKEAGWHLGTPPEVLPEYVRIRDAIKTLAEKDYRVVGEDAVAKTYQGADPTANASVDPKRKVGVLTTDEYDRYYPVGYAETWPQKAQMLDSQPTSFAFKVAVEFVESRIPKQAPSDEAPALPGGGDYDAPMPRPRQTSMISR